ncbi:MAG: hypothetical protein K2K10_11110, partial [Acetatifactor sp.]|nr:hypothetical protein [Acetatifactor sp.]
PYTFCVNHIPFYRARSIFSSDASCSKETLLPALYLTMSIPLRSPVFRGKPHLPDQAGRRGFNHCFL